MVLLYPILYIHTFKYHIDSMPSHIEYPHIYINMWYHQKNSLSNQLITTLFIGLCQQQTTAEIPLLLLHPT